jgi:APA family basic amino acid/polyamine antiporter
VAQPGKLLGVRDAVALMVGMVVGIGVFKAPAMVALRLDDPWVIIGLWALGALIVLVGALCYAELASSHPDAGGEYHFLALAFGPGLAFLFGWARLVVVQTGAIAAVAFVFGDYAQRLFNLGPFGASIYAALAVIGLTILNIRGTRLSANVQDGLAIILVTAVGAAAVAGFIIGPVEVATASAPAPGPVTSVAGIGFAMIFVMLTYGGWNEAAYLSAELKDVRRNMVRAMLIATMVVAGLYIAINAAYLYVLGPAAMRGSDAIGADYMRALAGAPGALALTVIVMVAALTTLNATLFTGARSAFALGRDTRLFTLLGRWDLDAQGPVNAHLTQAALALVLIGLGTATRKGFATMVDYTAPVFWFFLLATGLALFVLRRRAPSPEGAFRVPLFPLTPLLFCASSAYMLHSALAYTGVGALVGVGAVLLGLPVWWQIRRRAVHGRA